MRKVLDVPDKSEFQHNSKVVVQMFTKFLPLETILGLTLSDDSIELNDKAIEIFGLMSLESDAETLKFS